uniref:Transmembrane protein n=1 Tax=Eutreptiella gymnastica TaxID=73025 RepID=A0A7S4CMN3_9EUGL
MAELVGLLLFPIMMLVFEALKMHKCLLFIHLLLMLEMGKKFDNTYLKQWWPWGYATCASLAMGLTHGGRTFFNTLELKRIREEEEAEEEERRKALKKQLVKEKIK